MVTSKQIEFKAPGLSILIFTVGVLVQRFRQNDKYFLKYALAMCISGTTFHKYRLSALSSSRIQFPFHIKVVHVMNDHIIYSSFNYPTKRPSKNIVIKLWH